MARRVVVPTPEQFLGGRMTSVSLLLSTAGATLTLISCDSLGACPATASLLATQGTTRAGEGATGWTNANVKTLLSGILDMWTIEALEADE